MAELRLFACLCEPWRWRGAISIRHALTLALSRWRTTTGLYSSIRFELGRGGCFRVDNVSDGNLSDAACALSAAQNKAGYYVYSVLRPPRQPSPTRSRASASHCRTSRPPRCYRVSRYIIYPPPAVPHSASGAAQHLQVCVELGGVLVKGQRLQGGVAGALARVRGKLGGERHGGARGRIHEGAVGLTGSMSRLLVVGWLSSWSSG